MSVSSVGDGSDMSGGLSSDTRYIKRKAEQEAKTAEAKAEKAAKAARAKEADEMVFGGELMSKPPPPANGDNPFDS